MSQILSLGESAWDDIKHGFYSVEKAVVDEATYVEKTVSNDVRWVVGKVENGLAIGGLIGFLGLLLYAGSYH